MHGGAGIKKGRGAAGGTREREKESTLERVRVCLSERERGERKRERERLSEARKARTEGAGHSPVTAVFRSVQIAERPEDTQLPLLVHHP